jgi:hypothetical protein
VPATATRCVSASGARAGAQSGERVAGWSVSSKRSCNWIAGFLLFTSSVQRSAAGGARSAEADPPETKRGTYPWLAKTGPTAAD